MFLHHILVHLSSQRRWFHQNLGIFFSKIQKLLSCLQYRFNILQCLPPFSVNWLNRTDWTEATFSWYICVKYILWGGQEGTEKKNSSPLGMHGYNCSAVFSPGKELMSNPQASPQLCLSDSSLNHQLVAYQQSHQWPLGSLRTGTGSPTICRMATAHSYQNERCTL